ncbi:hypothetical protein QBC41DRAFT_306142 [Cercophora samala]|uniref:Uncharacterized protein n=1 Tax=Cercophora samala TaxID=330535 RepID=A0AA40D6V9_9PEZI|nr:hypothetical protein QBC41DRAFT_306142 [Cercophora samala]
MSKQAFTCIPVTVCAHNCKWAGIYHLGDPVLDFFANLPALALHHQKGPFVSWLPETPEYKQACRAVECFLETSATRSSADCELLVALRSWGRNLSDDYESALALYAVQQPVIDLDRRLDAHFKTGFLEYYRWLAQGSKDAVAPFTGQVVRKGLILPEALSRLPVSTEMSWRGFEADGFHNMEHENPEVRKLYRAYSMFESAFEMYLVHIFDDPMQRQMIDHTLDVGNVSEVNGVLVIDQDEEDASTYALPRDIRRAIMMYMSCEVPAESAWPLVKLFLQPVCNKIELLRITTRNVARPIFHRDEDENELLNTIVLHMVMLVELKCGKKYILDPTAAQYGWTETIVPWDIFKQYRMAEHRSSSPPTDDRTVYYRPDKDLRRIKLKVASEIQRRWGRGITAVLDLPTEQFPQERDWILWAMEYRMMDWYSDLQDKKRSTPPPPLPPGQEMERHLRSLYVSHAYYSSGNDPAAYDLPVSRSEERKEDSMSSAETQKDPAKIRNLQRTETMGGDERGTPDAGLCWVGGTFYDKDSKT